MRTKQKIVWIVCVGLLTLQSLAVGFDSGSSRRLGSPRLRRTDNSGKSTSSGVYYRKSEAATEETRTSSTARRRRQSPQSSESSLLPEGFDADESSSTTKTASQAAFQKSDKVLSAEGLALKDDIKVEFGEGHGETVEEALKEALKDVLQKVVGVYVDSDFRMNNDQIIKDEIITHSNGFIDHYKKIEESDDQNGRGKTVTIKAWVKVRDFVNRMKKIAPSQTLKMDGLLLDNEIDNNVNAETLLRKEFEGLDPILDLMEVGLVSSIKPEVMSTDNGFVVLRYVFAIRYSKEKYYQQFVRRTNRLFDQIATKKIGTRSVPFKIAQIDCHPCANEGARPDDYWKKHEVRAYYLLDQVGGRSSWLSKPERVISIVQALTRGGVATVKEWELSEHLKRVYDEIREKYNRGTGTIQCEFSVLDEDGQQLSSAVQSISKSNLFHCFSVEELPDFIPLMKVNWLMMSSDSYDKCISLVRGVSFSGGSYCSYVDKYIGYIDISIDKDDIKKIKSAEIKLRKDNKGEYE